MHFLHTMVRVTDIDASLKFYCDGLGLKEVRRTDNEAGRFTLIFQCGFFAVWRRQCPTTPWVLCPMWKRCMTVSRWRFAAVAPGVVASASPEC